MKPMLLIAFASIAAACNGGASSGPDAATPSLDPTGNWNVVYQFAASCDNAATTSTGTFTVTLGPNGYALEVAGVASQGVLECTTSECLLSGTWAWASSDTEFQQSMNLTLDDHDAVIGEGTEAVVTADSNCTYPFTVSGARM
jgi:hypothetical protein|nr:hypothetical protein [Kofleriaceae bacterium]